MRHTLPFLRLGWAVLPLAALAGCSSPAAPTAQPPSVVAVARGFQPSQGFGWQMTISSDLTVVDVNERHQQSDIQCVARVTPAQWNEVLGLVEQSNFFELQDYYAAPDQVAPFFTRVIRTDKLKTIYMVSGQPLPLMVLDVHLNSLRKQLQWTGRAGDTEAQQFCTGRIWIYDLS
jgi:hypothetical protein